MSLNNKKNMDTSFQSLSDAHLKQTCRALGIPVRGVSRQTMLELLKNNTIITSRRKRRKIEQNKYNCDAVIRIQRWWKKMMHTKTLCKRLNATNENDFLTLESITVRPFYLVEDTGHVYQFHPLSLAQYFLKEGNFTNPYTRKPLNIVELRRLDKMVKTHDPSFVSLYNEQKRITIQRSQEREHARVCQLLHQECLQLIHRVMQFVQTQQIRRLDRMMFQVEHVLLPQFFDTFRQLFLLDQSFACESICHILQVMHALWNTSSVVNTQEKCFLVENIISTMSQFITSVLPVLPAMLPELNQLQQVRVR